MGLRLSFSRIISSMIAVSPIEIQMIATTFFLFPKYMSILEFGECVETDGAVWSSLANIRFDKRKVNRLVLQNERRSDLILHNYLSCSVIIYIFV